MSQSALQSIELPVTPNEADLTVNPTIINSYKPVLVKTNKEIVETEDRRIDSKRINTSGNGTVTNDNKPSVTSFTRSIDIVASTVARIEQLYLLVQRNFIYKPNIELLINAIIETGRFDAKKVADNICAVFAEKEPTNSRKSAIHLSQSNLEKCRTIQAQVKDILEMDIDVHPVLNSMLYTGRFNARDIATALRKLFSEKRKVTLSQNSNRIN